MAKLWAVIKREYLERVRTKFFLVATIFIPVLLVTMMVLPALVAMKSRASSEVSHIAIIDATTQHLGDHLAAALTDSLTKTRPTVTRVTADGVARAESIATRRIVAKEIPGYVVLDSATAAGHRVRYAGRNASSIPDVERIRVAVQQSIVGERLVSAGIASGMADSLTRVKLDMSTQRIGDNGERGGSGVGGLALGFGIAFTLYFMIAIYGQQVMRGVIEEKTTRVAEVVVSSVKPDILLLGKVLGVVAVALTQLVVWIGASLYLAQLVVPMIMSMASTGTHAAPAETAAIMPSFSLTSTTVIVLFFLFGMLFYCSLWAAIGSTVSSEQEAQQAAIPMMFLLVPPMVMLNPIMLEPNGTLAQVFSWLPFSAPLIVPLRMVITSLAWWEVAGPLAVLLASTLGAVWLAARIYRVGLLMYGKRPSYGELMRWVRRSA